MTNKTNTSKKRNITKNQMAFSYALYMMAGSYFRKTVCVNPVLETKMRLFYAEDAADTQVDTEKLCISFMEEKLLPVMPDALWQEMMEVHMYVDERSGRTEICFIGADYMLRLFADSVGNRFQISHEIWTYGDKIKIRKKRKIAV